MAERLFGTDGVRGTAGEPPLDPHTIRRLAAALVRALPPSSSRPPLLVGRDTRESGEWIEREFAFGAAAEGARVTSAGVISTPAVAFLTRSMGFLAGVVISASHNPFQDNGIKVFSGAGEKFTEELEARVEAIVADPSWAVRDGEAGPVAQADLAEIYLEHVRSVLRDRDKLGSCRVVVDCANGATASLAPRLLRAFGFDVIVLNGEPDGRNINLGCGSTHPEQLARAVTERRARLGVAFDGDGDRAIFVDHRGRIVDGDAVMLMSAKRLKAAGRLRNDAIVATVMSNVGLELALRKHGIDLVRCPVGDKYVREEMARRDLSLGGEQSGHIIFSESLFTGDGLITTLNVLQAMAVTGQEIADLASDLVTYPQVLLNVRVRQKRDWRKVPEIAAAVERIEEQLGGNGRLLIRYSGTEPLLRIMLEGEDQNEIRGWAEEIAATARASLG